VKCGQYWPEDEDGIEQHGSFAVINNGVEVEEHYSVTSLILQNLEVWTRESIHSLLNSSTRAHT